MSTPQASDPYPQGQHGHGQYGQHPGQHGPGQRAQHPGPHGPPYGSPPQSPFLQPGQPGAYGGAPPPKRSAAGIIVLVVVVFFLVTMVLGAIIFGLVAISVTQGVGPPGFAVGAAPAVPDLLPLRG